MEITTRFAIATDEGTKKMLELTRELANEKFASLLDQKELQKYLEVQLNEKQLVAEMNDLSNQWLVVYAGTLPAGYAKITSKGKRPQVLENSRAARIADFAVLEAFPEYEIRNALLEKCLAVCRHHDGIWVNECFPAPLIKLFKNAGFEKQPEAWQHEELHVPSVCLVYLKSNVDRR